MLYIIYSRQNWTKSGVCGYKSQLCIEELSGSQVNSQLRFNYLMALCETATNDPKWGSLSLFPSAQDKMKISPLSLAAYRRKSHRRTSHFIVPDERREIVCAAEIGAQNRPICRESKNAPCGCMVCFALAHNYGGEHLSPFHITNTRIALNERERDAFSLYGVRPSGRSAAVIIYICCLLKGRGARRYRIYIQVRRRWMDERQSRCVTNRLHFAGLSDTFFCQPIAARVEDTLNNNVYDSLSALHARLRWQFSAAKGNHLSGGIDWISLC